MSEFEFRGKSFFFTYPQCTYDKKDAIEHISGIFKQVFNATVTEYVVAQETHEDGNPHLHCYVALNRELRCKRPVRLFDIADYHPNIQSTRSCKAVIKYCTKEDNFISNIPKKVDRYRREQTLKREELAKKLMEGTKLHTLVDDNPSLLFGYARIKADLQAYQLDKATIFDLPECCGIWIAGPAGCGKSTIAFTRFGDYYPKGKNKWFDGYNGQDTVVLDDVDESWKDYYYYWKWWFGAFKFLAEVKGATICIRPKRFIVTSNYTIEELLTKWALPESEWKPYTRRIIRSYWITSIDDWENQL